MICRDVATLCCFCSLANFVRHPCLSSWTTKELFTVLLVAALLDNLRHQGYLLALLAKDVEAAVGAYGGFVLDELLLPVV